MHLSHPEARPSEPRRRSTRALLVTLLAAAVALASSGCGNVSGPSVKMPRLKLPKLLGGGDAADAGPDGGEVDVVAFGAWTKDSIHCAEDHCQNFYGVIVDEPGELRAEVYAPWGGDLPDFDLALLDAEGQPIARPSDSDARPRRLNHHVEPGSYFLRVHSRGETDARLKYDIVAKLSTDAPVPSRPVARTSAPPSESDPTPTVKKASAQAPVSTPAPERDVLVTAEVLDVEEEGGAAAFVLIDAGAPQRVAEDMQGELKEGGRSIGQIVIVEVYTDGSRARVVGDLDGEVGIDTVAEIFH